MEASEPVVTFYGDPENDPEIAEELAALEASLTEKAAHTLERLEIRYHVDVVSVWPTSITFPHRIDVIVAQQSVIRILTE